MQTTDKHRDYNSQIDIDMGNPLEALNPQRTNHLGGDPSSGQVVEVEELGADYWIETRGSYKSGTNVFILGEVVENPLTGVEGQALKQAEIPENYVANALELDYSESASFEYADFDSSRSDVFQQDGETYFSLRNEFEV